jgi:hypothetical protein
LIGPKKQRDAVFQPRLSADDARIKKRAVRRNDPFFQIKNRPPNPLGVVGQESDPRRSDLDRVGLRDVRRRLLRRDGKAALPCEFGEREKTVQIGVGRRQHAFFIGKTPFHRDAGAQVHLPGCGAAPSFQNKTNGSDFFRSSTNVQLFSSGGAGHVSAIVCIVAAAFTRTAAVTMNAHNQPIHPLPIRRGQEFFFIAVFTVFHPDSSAQVRFHSRTSVARARSDGFP